MASYFLLSLSVGLFASKLLTNPTPATHTNNSSNNNNNNNNEDDHENNTSNSCSNNHLIVQELDAQNLLESVRKEHPTSQPTQTILEEEMKAKEEEKRMQDLRHFFGFYDKTIVPVTETTTTLQEVNSFPRKGVRLSYVVALFQHPAAKERLKGKTTTQVCEEFVKPVTKEFQCSFCELLTFRESPHVDVATVFISHAWKYQFLDVLDAIIEYFRRQEINFDKVILWFDLFCNNQHKAVQFDFHWWCNTFLSAIKEINHTVMIFAPWNDPIPLTRAWCVWELYCTISTSSQFSVALSKEQQRMFIQDIATHPDQVIKKMLATIDSENSSAFIPADRDRIHEVVRSTVGFSALNSLIFEKMREWIIWAAEKEFSDQKKTEEQRAEIHQALVKLYHLQGDHAKAKAAAELSLQDTMRLFGKLHSHTLDARNDLACILYDMDQIEDAEMIYKEILTALENPEVLKVVPDGTAFKIKLQQNIAGCYLQTGDYEQAEQYYLLALHEHEAQNTYISDPIHYLSTLSNLSMAYMNQGKYNQAEAILRKALAIQRDKLGDSHLDTLNTMNLLAVTLKYQNKLEEADPLCQECFQRRRTVLGPNNWETLESMVSLATLFMRQDRGQEAEDTLKEIMYICTKSLGDQQHPTILTAMKNLAVCYMNRGNYQDALPIYLDCYEKTLTKYGGEEHIESIMMMINLASTYAGLGDYRQTDAYYTKALSIGMNVMGPDHPTYANYLVPRCETFRVRLAFAIDALLPTEVNLSAEQHLHPLIKCPCNYQDSRYYCDLCGASGLALAYRCAECGYDLHPHCAVSNYWQLVDQWQEQQRQHSEEEQQLQLEQDQEQSE